MPSSVLGLDVGSNLKDFALRNAEGGIVTLGKLSGGAEAVMLEFLSVYCHTCRESVPVLNGIVEEYENRGLAVVAVALENDQKELNEFVDRYKVKYPIFADPEKSTYYLYGVREVPMIYLVDGFGIIRYRGFPMDEESFKGELNSLFGREEGVLQAGDGAPDFTLRNLKGEPLDFAALRRHRTTVLAFFGGEDALCVDQALVLGRLHERYEDAGVRVVGIGAGLSQVDALKFVERCSIQFPFLVDGDRKVTKQYQVSRYPEVFVVNELGRILRMGSRISYSGLVKVVGEGEEGESRALSRGEIEKLLARAMPEAETFKAVKVDGETIYVGGFQGGRKEYARFVQKDTLCDVCPDVHFLYTIDESGVIDNMVMIQSLERYGTPIEGREFLQQFIGKSHHETFVVGEMVDVIAGATKSSLKIIEGLNETEAVFASYVGDPQFDAPYRRRVCFTHEADIEWAVQRLESEHGYVVLRPDARELTPYFSAGEMPGCPAGGTYRFINFNNILRVMCSIHGVDPGASEIY
jgi:peroxiredoxin